MTRKISRAALALLAVALGLVGGPAVAQQGSAEVRGRVTDAQGGALPGVSHRAPAPGVRAVPPDRLHVGRQLLHERRSPPAPTSSPPSCPRSRSSRGGTCASRSARRPASTCAWRWATARRRSRSPRNRPSWTSRPRKWAATSPPGTHRPAHREPQLHRLHRAAPGRDPEHQHRVVRVRRGRRQRPGLPQQQLPPRRRQQQRRRHRPAGGHPGPDAAGGHPGVPGHHQPVRRGVRAHHGGGDQRHHEAGDELLPRERLRVPAGRLADGEGLLRRAEQPDQARHEFPAVRA